MERIFNPRWQRYTPKNKLNFIGTTIRYFEDINKEWKESTKDQYFNTYQNKIFPLIDVSKPIDEYDDDYLTVLINLIKIRINPGGDAISTVYMHLLVDPCHWYFEEYSPDINPFWGTSYRTNYKNTSNDESVYLIKKSFTPEENKKAFKALVSNPYSEKGEDIGLALMFLVGARINEICGMNFGDIHEMKMHKGCYYVTIGYATTRLHSNQLKAGGKTANSPRRLPLTPAAASFILERKQYVENNIAFPCTNEYGDIIESIERMPISSRKGNLASRTKSDDLTVHGRMFFRDVLKIRENEIADISSEIFNSSDIEEKDATTYLLRRNMATHLFICGLSKLEQKYYMGHSLEGYATVRKDFNDEELLYNIYVKLLKYSLFNNSTNYKMPQK